MYNIRLDWITRAHKVIKPEPDYNFRTVLYHEQQNLHCNVNTQIDNNVIVINQRVYGYMCILIAWNS